MRTLIVMALMSYVYNNSKNADAVLWLMLICLFIAFADDVITVIKKATK